MLRIWPSDGLHIIQTDREPNSLFWNLNGVGRVFCMYYGIVWYGRLYGFWGAFSD